MQLSTRAIGAWLWVALTTIGGVGLIMLGQGIVGIVGVVAIIIGLISLMPAMMFTLEDQTDGGVTVVDEDADQNSQV